MFLTELQRGAAPRSQLVPALRLPPQPQPPSAPLERPPSGRLAPTSANRSRPHLASAAAPTAAHALRAGLPDGYASTRDANAPIPAGASVYALSSHSSAVASRSPTRVPPRSRPEVIVAAPPAPLLPVTLAAAVRTPVAPSKLAPHPPRPPPQRATTSATVSAAATRTQRVASPFDLGDDHGYDSTSSSSGDEYDLYSSRSSTVMRARGGESDSRSASAAVAPVERESVLAYLPDSAHAHLPPTIDLALKRTQHRGGGGNNGSGSAGAAQTARVEPESNRASARYASSASAFSIGALTARENSRLGDLYDARAARTERLQQQEWSERAMLGATGGGGGAGGDAKSGAAVFDQMVAKIKQVLGMRIAETKRNCFVFCFRSSVIWFGTFSVRRARRGQERQGRHRAGRGPSPVGAARQGRHAPVQGICRARQD